LNHSVLEKPFGTAIVASNPAKVVSDVLIGRVCGGLFLVPAVRCVTFTVRLPKPVLCDQSPRRCSSRLWRLPGGCGRYRTAGQVPHHPARHITCCRYESSCRRSYVHLATTQ